MSDPVKIKMGGYGPPTTTHSRGLKFIGDALEARFGDGVEIEYLWNIMDHGYRGDQIMELTESGFLTISYQSTSYLTHRVPELGFVDLPFLFPTLEAARAAYDGALGDFLKERIEEQYNFRVLGYFENGFRHISNRLHPIHLPEDLAGMKIRMLPSDIHERTFALLGAEPLQMDLTEAIAGVKDGSLDAQENPFANTATYGVHQFHPYHTKSSHFYLSRGLWSHRDTVDAWPDDLRQAVAEIIPQAVAHQRGLAVEEEDVARKVIEDAGCEVVELNDTEHAAFAAKVAPLLDEARDMFGDAMFDMLP